MTSSNFSERRLLTILVEDYFHVGAFENLIRQSNWQNFEPRYEQNTLRVLDILDKRDAKATFFVLGWIAERTPDLLKEIVARGHEIASRGFYHRSLRQLTADEFREDLRRTNEAIEKACGQKVIGFRAAEKLKYDQDLWVIDVLAEEGFAYDASFLPIRKDDPAKRIAHQIHTGGRVIWEFPYTTQDVGFGLLPISGGNYLRQIPYTLMRYAVQDWPIRNNAPFVFYFHVWELDPEQPRISAASRLNRIRHYRKLDKMEWVLTENLELYDFTGIGEHLGITPSHVSGHEPDTVSENAAFVKVAKKELKPISIVVPCYNEEDSLPYLSNALRSVEAELAASSYRVELIFVDDCSEDDTHGVLTRLFGSRDNVQIISHERNKGVAEGLLTGIHAAETEIVASIDCDCTYDPHELVNMLPLLTSDVDLVTASPYHPEGGVRNVPGWRLFLSKGASFLYRRVLRSKLNTYTSCFRVYRRSSFTGLKISESGFLGVAEMLGRLDLAGGRIVEHPAVLDVRLFGISKMKTAKTVAGHISLLSKLAANRLFGKSTSIQPSLPTEKLSIASKKSN